MDIISSAHAALPAANGVASANGSYSSLIMLAVFFAVFYLLLWRPQAKRAKEQRALLSALSKGDEVVAAGGLVGRILDVNENFLTLDVSKGVALTVQKGSVTSVLPKGTLKLMD